MTLHVSKYYLSTLVQKYIANILDVLTAQPWNRIFGRNQPTRKNRWTSDRINKSNGHVFQLKFNLIQLNI